MKDSQSDQEEQFREETQIESSEPSAVPLTTEPAGHISIPPTRISKKMSDTMMSPSGRPAEASRSGIISTQRELPVAELGSYRLVQLLGGGGMGEVFLAEHKQLGRKVALKVLRRELSNSPEVVRRFVDEARLVNQIKNEHIVEIHDFGEGPDGLQYFVMEFLVGRDLAQAREMDGPFGLNRSLDVVRQVASALVAVHERKIIHRDLKPENIYLAEKSGRKDFVKLLDFGLAKLTEGTGSARDGTAIGTLLGTPLYMSPEQAMGLRVDWRTDIFSLGLVLLWMLTDQLPHESGTAEEIRRRRANEPLPPIPNRTTRSEAIPQAVGAVLAGCLDRDPTRRIQSMQEILDRLPVPPPSVTTNPGARPGLASLRAGAPNLSRGNSGPGTSRPPPAAASGPGVLLLRNSSVSPPEKAPVLPKSALLAAGLGAGVTLVGIVLWLVFRPTPPIPDSPQPPGPAEQVGSGNHAPGLADVPTVASATPPPVPVVAPAPVAPANAVPPNSPSVAPSAPVAGVEPSVAAAPKKAPAKGPRKPRPAPPPHKSAPVNDPGMLIDPFNNP